MTRSMPKPPDKTTRPPEEAYRDAARSVLKAGTTEGRSSVNDWSRIQHTFDGGAYIEATIFVTKEMVEREEPA